jgi:chromosome segregation ATPase
MKTTPTTAVNNLLIDYNKKIDYLNSQIAYNQKLIETDKATISLFKEKINTLHEVLNELNVLTSNDTTAPKVTKDISQLKLSDITPRGQCNAINNPIKPLTEEQIKKFSETFNKQNNSSKVLEDALKSLEATIDKDSYYLIDVKYNDEAKWPMDL